MVKNDILSAAKANRLYWLGRYETRVYLTLHQLNKCYDKMIDGEPGDYAQLRLCLDPVGKYKSNEDFMLGMLYDADNPSSLMSAQNYAMDNAILLREDIMSETLSYVEMSIALMNRCRQAGETNITLLQSVKDWALAFWGSAEQRVQSHKALGLMVIGRNVEYVDMLMRFGYSRQRVVLAFETLKHYCEGMESMLNVDALEQLDALMTNERFDLNNDDNKALALGSVNRLVKV